MTRVYPCYGCTKRHEGCHAECDGYAEAEKLNREDREKRYAENFKESELIGHFADQARKRKRRKGYSNRNK